MGADNLPTIDDGIDHIARKFFGSTWDENYGGAIGGTSIPPDVTGGPLYSTGGGGGVGGGGGMDGVYEDYGGLMREEGGNDEMMGWQGEGGGGDMNGGAGGGDGYDSNGRTPLNMQHPSQQQYQQQYQQQQQQYQQQQQQYQSTSLAPLLYTPTDR